MKLFTALVLSVLLTNCMDPMMMDMGRDPYADPYGNQRRADMRDQGRNLGQMAYDRGNQDGQADAQQRQSQNYNRHRDRYDRNTEMAYRDGYNQSYSASNSSLGTGFYNGTPPPDSVMPTQVAPANEPAFNQGYDFGLRDRTAGRVADPAVHVGRYDPRNRASFERGYYDGYNARSNMNSGSGTIPLFR